MSPISHGQIEFDELTDLPNMMYFRRHASAYVRTAHRFGRDAFLVYFNLENFSGFNERYGFEEGDKLLRLMSVSIQSAFPGFLLSRFASDHFLLVCQSLDIERAIVEARDEIHSYGRHANVELKAGIFKIEGDAPDIGVACDRAKIACDSISGRYDVAFRWFDEALNWRIERGKYVVSHIDRAIANDWIEVYYQPVVRSMTGEVCEFEALARWNDPRYGFLSPAVFVGVLEESHLIHKLDAYVVRKACEEWRRLSKISVWRVPVSINLSRLDFELCDVFELVDSAAREFDVPRQMLHVEITESALNDNAKLLGRAIGRFRDAGYQVWLDDFGSGYSSLNTLKDYVFDVVKIDMGFLREFESRPKSRVIIATIVNMAKRLGMQTLIEGVETPEQFEFLRGIGCELVQGFLIGKPSASAENIRRIEEGELVIEPGALHGYYDRLGSINSLSATPFEFAWDSGTKEHAFADMLPLAILEGDRDEYRFVTGNDAFASVLSDVELGSMADLARAISHSEGRHGRIMREALVAAAESGGIESVDMLSDRYHCVLRVRLISSHDSVKAYLVSIMDVTRFSDVGENSRLNIALRYLYAVYDEVNVVDVHDGLISTLYRGNTFFPVIVRDTPVIEHVRSFAADYLHPEDGKRYLEYMNMGTVEERVSTSGKDHLAEAFRALQPNGLYVWVTIELVPVLVAGRRVVLMCSRRTNTEVISTIEGEETIPKSLLWDTLLELVPAGVFWKDDERRFVGVNKNFLDFYDFKSTMDVLGKTDEDMGWHVDTDPFMNNELRVLEGESVLNAQGTCIAQGEVRNIVASKIPLRRGGEIVGLLGYFTDAVWAGDNTRSLMLDGFNRMSETDQLTGIPNLRGMMSSAVSYQESFEDNGPDFMCVLADITGISDYGKVYGRSFVNRVIKVVARSLAKEWGVDGVVARVGGNRFAAIRQVMSKDEAAERARSFRKVVECLRDVDGIDVRLGCNIGWSLFSEKGETEATLKVAEARMGDAKMGDAEKSDAKAGDAGA
jgi:diguanylate cyclase (GGDEF)-like protein